MLNAVKIYADVKYRRFFCIIIIYLFENTRIFSAFL